MAEHARGTLALDDDPLVGTVVAGRYRVLNKLGEGGMGAVYRGVHETLHRPVAIKFLLQHGRAAKEMAARFKREAIAAANLEHPNIATVTDNGQLSDGTLFLVMEFVEGTPLRDVLASAGRLPPSRALHILRQLGAALTRAHSFDIVHRDLKPDNVIVFDRGAETDVVKVIDFGIARMKSSTFGGKDTTQLTRMGSVFGTPVYMAPEQVMGQPVDTRADQYALGVMAFEMFTGRVPYDSDDSAQALMFMHVGADIPKVTAYAPDLPEALSVVVAKMMAKLPDDRFASVSDALSAMAEALGEPLHPSLPRPSMVRPSVPQTAVATELPSAAKPFALAPTAMAVSQTHPHSFTPKGTAIVSAVTPAPTHPPKHRLPVKLIVAGLAVLWVAGIVWVSLRLTVFKGGDLADARADWTDKRYAEASSKLKTALTDRPDDADDTDLAAALTGSLRDREAQRELDTLMESTALGRSRVMAESLAGVALNGEREERDASLDLLRGRRDLLDAVAQARVSLRDAEDCAALSDALAAIVKLGPGPGQDDIRQLSSSDCKDLLRRRDLCQQCLRGGGKGKGKGKKDKD